jgi:hypothetical protein
VPGIDFTKLRFGQFFIRKFWTKFHPKSTVRFYYYSVLLLYFCTSLGFKSILKPEKVLITLLHTFVH